MHIFTPPYFYFSTAREAAPLLRRGLPFICEPLLKAHSRSFWSDPGRMLWRSLCARYRSGEIAVDSGTVQYYPPETALFPPHPEREGAQTKCTAGLCEPKQSVHHMIVR